MTKIHTITDVVKAHLCCGCGVCSYLSNDHYRIVDIPEIGRRPQNADSRSYISGEETELLGACPGIRLRRFHNENEKEIDQGLFPAWGPVLNVYEGYASSEEIRFQSSSGGAATALSLYCIEKGGFNGVLQTQARPDIAYLNQTVLSKTREQVIKSAGSRYSPASPCEKLGYIEEASGPCVFIGKPCDIAAVSNVRKARPALDTKLALTIGIFCAGTPSTKATEIMLKEMGIDDIRSVKSLRYRGMGWPGLIQAVSNASGEETVYSLPYSEGWGMILQPHRPWRCYICIDHAGEFADIAVGDPWYRINEKEAMGHSLIVVRTERGMKALKEAVSAGYLKIDTAPSNALVLSQPKYIEVRGKVWARIVISRILGAAAPRYERMPLFRYWVFNLSIGMKIRVFINTLKRLWHRR